MLQRVGCLNVDSLVHFGVDDKPRRAGIQFSEQQLLPIARGGGAISVNQPFQGLKRGFERWFSFSPLPPHYSHQLPQHQLRRRRDLNRVSSLTLAPERFDPVRRCAYVSDAPVPDRSST
jgi:hypothetical protein